MTRSTRRRPEVNSTLVVLGTGAVGSGAIMAGRVAVCEKVIAVDIHDSRRRGVDYIVDTTARPELLRQAADSLGLRGTLVLVGAAAPGTEVSFEIGLSLVKGLTFKTVVQGSRNATTGPGISAWPCPFRNCCVT